MLSEESQSQCRIWINWYRSLCNRFLNDTILEASSSRVLLPKFCSKHVCSYSPKYLHGKDSNVPVNEAKTWSRSTSWHLIEWTVLFRRFMCRPDTVLNSCRMVVVASRSSLVGLMKIAALLAYIEILHLAAARGSLERNPCCVAMSINRCSGSMARMKSMGERGLPCQTPLLWLKADPCYPLSNTFDDAVWKRIETHSCHRGPKPNACWTSNI